MKNTQSIVFDALITLLADNQTINVSKLSKISGLTRASIQYYIRLKRKQSLQNQG